MSTSTFSQSHNLWSREQHGSVVGRDDSVDSRRAISRRVLYRQTDWRASRLSAQLSHRQSQIRRSQDKAAVLKTLGGRRCRVRRPRSSLRFYRRSRRPPFCRQSRASRGRRHLPRPGAENPISTVPRKTALAAGRPNTRRSRIRASWIRVRWNRHRCTRILHNRLGAGESPAGQPDRISSSQLTLFLSTKPGTVSVAVLPLPSGLWKSTSLDEEFVPCQRVERVRSVGAAFKRHRPV